MLRKRNNSFASSRAPVLSQAVLFVSVYLSVAVLIDAEQSACVSDEDIPAQLLNLLQSDNTANHQLSGYHSTLHCRCARQWEIPWKWDFRGNFIGVGITMRHYNGNGMEMGIEQRQ